MIDIKIIRENPDLVRQAVKDRHDNAPLDEIIVLDERYRMSLQQVETLRAKRNETG
jgi:seryl-tRNA synthetase